MAQDAGVKSVPALRDFGRQVQQMGEQMYNLMLQAQKRMNYVSEGWRDDQNDRFKVRFDESVQMIKKMSEDFTAYNQYITKACDILEGYKENRLNI